VRNIYHSLDNLRMSAKKHIITVYRGTETHYKE